MDNENFNVEFGEVVNIGGGTSDFNQLSNRPKYNNATMTGDTNIPKVPTKTSELNNDSDYQTGTEVSSAIETAVSGLDIPTKTSDLTNDGSDGTSTYVESDDLATVATSGSYNDLSNTPTIPESQVQSDWSQTDNTKVDFIKNKPTIPSAQVNADWNASSGVAEILNKPTIPTVNDATLTITQNGTTKGTFTANDADDTTIEVSDTTYSDFTGTDGTAAGTAGLVPAPATTDAGKFLKADGTWDTVGAGGDIVYSTVTTSNAANGGAVYIGDKDTNQAIQSDPTSTDKHYKYFWALPNSTSNVPWNNTVNIMGGISNYGSGSVSILGLGATQDSVEIGNHAYAEGVNSVAIGKSSDSKTNGVAIGEQANGRNYSVSIGSGAGLYSAGDMVSCVNIGNRAGVSSQSGNNFSVNLGANSRGTRKGEVNVGLVTGNTTSGYNDSAYRVIGGVYDGQLDHDVVTVGQLNGRISQNAGAPTTSTVGTVGQLLEDTTNGKLYQCTAIDTTDPQNPSYTWSEVGAGGSGPTVVQTIGTSTTDVMSQDATTKLIYPDIANSPYKMVIGEGSINGTNEGLAINGIINTGINGGSIAIGATDASYAQIGQNGRADQSVAIGNAASAGRGMQSVAIGTGAYTNSGQNTGNNVAIGTNTNAGMGSATSTVALGAYAQTTRTGEVNIGTGTTTNGYNSTNYRVLGGVHDPVDNHDAATKGYVDPTTDASAPTTATVGRLGQIQIDTTTATAYMCVAVDTVTPAYTWKQITA